MANAARLMREPSVLSPHRLWDDRRRVTNLCNEVQEASREAPIASSALSPSKSHRHSSKARFEAGGEWSPAAPSDASGARRSFELRGSPERAFPDCSYRVQSQSEYRSPVP